MSPDHESDRPLVVVGVDGSDGSKAALRWAASVAAGIGATLDVIAAWQMPVAADLPIVATDWNLEEYSATMLEETMTEVFGTDQPVDAQLLVRQGNPAQVLLSASEQATMLVVGSRGHGGFVGLLIGSVSARCAERAGCPVLVVHGTALPRWQNLGRQPCG